MHDERIHARKLVTACVVGTIGAASLGYIIHKMYNAPLSTRDKVFLTSFATVTYSYLLKEVIKNVRPAHEKIALAGLLALTMAATLNTTLLANHRMACL